MHFLTKAGVLPALLCLWLSGCASDPALGLADTSGFDARGATVLVEYAVAADEDTSAAELEALRQARVAEAGKLLAVHGFQPVQAGASDFRIRIVEDKAEEVTGEWKGALGVNVVLFTLGVVPAMFDYRAHFHYELWAEDAQVHAIAVPSNWEEAKGLISLSSTLSGASSARNKARVQAHDSVFRLWIEQGSFE